MKERKIAYVVTRGEYSDYCIECIFDTLEEAEKYVMIHSNGDPDDMRVEEHPINSVAFEGEINIDDAGYCYDGHEWVPMRRSKFEEQKKTVEQYYMSKRKQYPFVWLPEKDNAKASKILQDIRAYNDAVRHNIIQERIEMYE